MVHPLQSWLFQQIERNLPQNQLLVHAVQPVLAGQSASTIYKKIRCETALSMEEIVQLAQYFDIRLDDYVHQDKNEAVVMHSAAPQGTPSPLYFLEKLQERAQMLQAVPNLCLWYATNELPIFHYLASPNLLTFKLYMWSRINWKLPEYTEHKFSPEAMTQHFPDLLSVAQKVWEFYAHLPSREYWPSHILDNTLNQIKHCYHSGLFEDRNTARLLCHDLRSIMDDKYRAAQAGRKNGADSTRPSPQFELFFNQIAYTNNMILLFSGDTPIGLYTTLDNPNYLECKDRNLLQYVAHWLERIETSSVKISQHGEQPRYRLFDHTTLQIDALEKEVL